MSKRRSNQRPTDAAIVRRLVVNPFYCIDLSPDLVGVHKPLGSTEDWIVINAKLIDQMGVTEWLSLLLAELSDPHRPA
jgi:hypothetical protein